MARYTPDNDCFDAANKAANGRLNREEIEAAFQRIYDYRERLKSEGRYFGREAVLRKFAAEEGERAKEEARRRKRHAAMNILVRDRLNQSIDSHIKNGMTPQKALLTILEGSAKGTQNARVSIAATNLAYEARFAGGFMSDLKKRLPHIEQMLGDRQFDSDLMREMAEQREGGNPGLTGNADAKAAAEIAANYAEMARTDLNGLGADIKKLNGWAGVQAHDDVKMLRAGDQAWIDFVLPRIDIERTFPEGLTPGEVMGALRGVYETLVTGFDPKVQETDLTRPASPANLAKTLGNQRVLHFVNADAALEYRDTYGPGNTLSGLFSYFRRSARIAANMEVLGPNPENMFAQVTADTLRKVNARTDIDAKTKTKWGNALKADARTLRHALDIATGVASRPDNTKAATIGADIRALQSMSKLGGAVISAFGDVPITGAASMFRGGGFWHGVNQQLAGLMQGRPRGEAAELSYLLGEGFDGIVGRIGHPYAAEDAPLGVLSGWLEKYFRLNGLTWWTDTMRGTAVRVIASEMGMRSKTAYDDLPANYRHVLDLHGINAAKWKLIQKSGRKEVNGRDYITPDQLRLLPDGDIASLAGTRYRKARTDEARQQVLTDTRRDLELSVLRFFADETNYGVIESDPRSRRTTTLGTRPGTLTGEAMRYIMQFKGFPISFSQRVLGRAVYGHRADATMLERGAHIGAIIAGMTVAGYMSMTVKDMLKGYWPPRDPAKFDTWMAAATQGGGFGIYGDFLFSTSNRYNGSLADTLAGPAAGTVTQLYSLYADSRDATVGEKADFPKARALNLLINSVPGANLFYTKPALDYLFLNALREASNPGYLRRQERNRRRDYGQESFVPRTIQ